MENVECRMKSAYAKAVLLAALLAAFAGCSRDEKASAGDGAAVSPAAPESYMKDSEFRGRLDGQTAKRGELAKARNAIVAQMSEMIEAKKKELGTGDEAVLKAALEKDPAWRELYARCQDVNAAIGENGRETMAIVRERLTRKK